jgi:hypothetical protein
MAAWFLLRIVIVDNSDVFPQSDIFARLWRNGWPQSGRRNFFKNAM